MRQSGSHQDHGVFFSHSTVGCRARLDTGRPAGGSRVALASQDGWTPRWLLTHVSRPQPDAGTEEGPPTCLVAGGGRQASHAAPCAPSREPAQPRGFTAPPRKSQASLLLCSLVYPEPAEVTDGGDLIACESCWVGLVGGAASFGGSLHSTYFLLGTLFNLSNTCVRATSHL